MPSPQDEFTDAPASCPDRAGFPSPRPPPPSDIMGFLPAGPAQSKSSTLARKLLKWRRSPDPRHCKREPTDPIMSDESTSFRPPCHCFFFFFFFFLWRTHDHHRKYSEAHDSRRGPPFRRDDGTREKRP